MDLFSSVAQNQGHGRVGASPWTSCQSVAGLNLSKKLMKLKKSRKGVSGMQRLPKTWMETRLVRSCLKSLHIQCEKYWSNKCMWASISAETERTWYIIPFADTSMIQYDTTPPPTHTHQKNTKVPKWHSLYCIAGSIQGCVRRGAPGGTGPSKMFMQYKTIFILFCNAALCASY